MSIFALLRRLERITRPAPSLAHDYDLPMQDVEQEIPFPFAAEEIRHLLDESPQPSPVTTRTSAGDRSAAAGILPPTAAAEPLTWLGWAVPAILDVLAEHTPFADDGDIWCDCNSNQLFEDVSLWSEHVAPLIAERIACDPERAEAALGAGYEFVKGVEAAANIVATAAVKQSHKAINSPHLIDGMDMASALDRLTAELRTHADEYRPK